LVNTKLKGPAKKFEVLTISSYNDDKFNEIVMLILFVYSYVLKYTHIILNYIKLDDTIFVVLLFSNTAGRCIFYIVNTFWFDIRCSSNETSYSNIDVCIDLFNTATQGTSVYYLCISSFKRICCYLLQ